MKKLILGVVLLVVGISVHAQNYEVVAFRSPVSPVLTHSKEMPGTTNFGPGVRMRNTGRTLTIVGSVLFVGGVIVAQDARNTIDPLTGKQTPNDAAYSAAYMLVAGVGMTVPGIIFWVRGASKMRKAGNNTIYPQTISLHPYPYPGGAGTSVKVRF